eukprot:1905860-Rhodomonas_salina.1
MRLCVSPSASAYALLHTDVGVCCYQGGVTHVTAPDHNVQALPFLAAYRLELKREQAQQPAVPGGGNENQKAEEKARESAGGITCFVRLLRQVWY